MLSSNDYFVCRYKVIKKDTKTVKKKIEQLIQNEFPNDSGLIYCLTTQECEQMAKKLQVSGESE
jgi:superfamily II DNA helicase RecQ